MGNRIHFSMESNLVRMIKFKKTHYQIMYIKIASFLGHLDDRGNSKIKLAKPLEELSHQK